MQQPSVPFTRPVDGSVSVDAIERQLGAQQGAQARQAERSMLWQCVMPERH